MPALDEDDDGWEFDYVLWLVSADNWDQDVTLELSGMMGGGGSRDDDGDGGRGMGHGDRDERSKRRVPFRACGGELRKRRSRRRVNPPPHDPRDQSRSPRGRWAGDRSPPKGTGISPARVRFFRSTCKRGGRTEQVLRRLGASGGPPRIPWHVVSALERRGGGRLEPTRRGSSEKLDEHRRADLGAANTSQVSNSDRSLLDARCGPLLLGGRVGGLGRPSKLAAAAMAGVTAETSGARASASERGVLHHTPSWHLRVGFDVAFSVSRREGHRAHSPSRDVKGLKLEFVFGSLTDDPESSIAR